MENKDNSFKKRISELAKANKPSNENKLNKDELEDSTVMNKIGKNARIALKIMLNGEER